MVLRCNLSIINICLEPFLEQNSRKSACNVRIHRIPCIIHVYYICLRSVFIISIYSFYKYSPQLKVAQQFAYKCYFNFVNSNKISFIIIALSVKCGILQQ